MHPKSPSHPLSLLYIYLADQCNLSCRHCWISPEFSSTKGNVIPIDFLKKTIVEAKELGLQSVKLTGGEPLLYEKIYELLDFLEKEDIGVIIETNGILLNKRIVEKLKSCKLDQVSVSLDSSTPDLHDELRGVKGSFVRTIAGLELLSRHDIGFQIIMTLYRKNSGEIDGMISLSQDVGAESLKINPLLPCGRGREIFDNEENLSPGELIQLYRAVEKKWPSHEKIEIIFDLPIALRSIKDITSRGIVECRILNILGILANGDFSLCGIGQTMEELRMGNIHKDSIKDVWQDNSILNDLRHDLPQRLKGICSRCIFRFQCLGSCRANAYGMNKDLFAPYFLCQESYELGLFPDSRSI